MKKIESWISGIVFISFWLSLMSIDSESPAPFIVLVASWLYLAVLAWRKGWIYKPERDEADV